MRERTQGIPVELIGNVGRLGLVVFEETVKEVDRRGVMGTSWVMGNELTTCHQFVILGEGCLFALCLSGKAHRVAVKVDISSVMRFIEVGLWSLHGYCPPRLVIFLSLPK